MQQGGGAGQRSPAVRRLKIGRRKWFEGSQRRSADNRYSALCHRLPNKLVAIGPVAAHGDKERARRHRPAVRRDMRITQVSRVSLFPVRAGNGTRKRWQ
jgi:hypothetical protein